MLQKDDLNNLLAIKTRHLQKLEEKKASFGLYTPAYILIEIEDLQSEIQNLQIQLKELEASDLPYHTIVQIEAINILRDDSLERSMPSDSWFRFLSSTKVMNLSKNQPYALEILVSNQSFDTAFINTATVMGFKYRHGVSYARWPSIYTYELNIQLEAYSEKNDFVWFDGVAKETESQWGRPVSGYILTQGKHRFEFEITFPVFLQIKPKTKGLMRFIFNKHNTVAIGKKKNTRGDTFSQKNLRLLKTAASEDGWKNYSTGIILEGDFNDPVLGCMQDDSLLTYFITNN